MRKQKQIGYTFIRTFFMIFIYRIHRRRNSPRHLEVTYIFSFSNDYYMVIYKVERDREGKLRFKQK